MDNPPTPIQLICFDLGGVLVRIASSWEDALVRSGGSLEMLAGVDADALARAHEPVLHALETGRMEEDEYHREAAKVFGVTPRQMEAFINAWLVEPYPGVDELLDDLAAAGRTTACLSNTSAPHWRMMHDDAHHARLPLEKLNHRFASHLAGAMKPDAAIYQHVESTLGLPGEAILFFDDYGKNIEGAQSRGWQTHKIDAQGDTCGQIRQVLAQRGLL